MKKMTKENVVETIIDYNVDYDHIIDSFYEKGDFIIIIHLLKDNPKEVGDIIYDDLMDDAKLLKYLNSIDFIVKLVISNPRTYKSVSYEI